jgi:hypothetical protein
MRLPWAENTALKTLSEWAARVAIGLPSASQPRRTVAGGEMKSRAAANRHRRVFDRFDTTRYANVRARLAHRRAEGPCAAGLAPTMAPPAAPYRPDVASLLRRWSHSL